MATLSAHLVLPNEPQPIASAQPVSAVTSPVQVGVPVGAGAAFTPVHPAFRMPSSGDAPDVGKGDLDMVNMQATATAAWPDKLPFANLRGGVR